MTDQTSPNVTTIAGMVPNTCTHILVVAGVAALDVCSPRGGASTVLLDDLSRRALIVALGGHPDEPLTLAANLHRQLAEERAKVERLDGVVKTVVAERDKATNQAAREMIQTARKMDHLKEGILGVVRQAISMCRNGEATLDEVAEKLREAL